MSAFDMYEKDEVVDAIVLLAKIEKENGKSYPDIIKSVMEAISYSLEKIAYEQINE